MPSPNSYKGFQLSLLQADQWYKEGGDNGEEGADERYGTESGEVGESGGVDANGGDGTESDGVGADDDQLLKTPPALLPPLCVHVPGLPTAELNELMEILFRHTLQFWGNLAKFETVWSDCITSIGQACKRLCTSK